MPWEKSFNEDDALAKAMLVFWEKGYASASMADLIEEMGITRGSLYNAFGGKEQLFIRSLQKYDRDSRRAMLAQLEVMDDPKRAITTFFDNIISEAISDPRKKGCFLINTASELEVHGAEVNQVIREGMGELDAFFQRSIELAQARKQLPEHLNPQATAKGLSAMVVAMRVLGRGAFDEAALRTIADQALRLLR